MNEVMLEMQGIHKRFPGVYALKDVSFSLRTGEVHALVGENGAGKSTLMNVLMGIYRPDQGTIRLDGVETQITSPNFAIRHNIGLVPQELNVVPEISVAENIFMGIPNLKRGIVLDWKATNSAAQKIMESLGCHIDVKTRARDCTVAQLQMVQIGRMLAFGAKIMIFDEPTASLTSQETRDLFLVIEKLKEQGAGIIFISHHLEEVEEISDRVSVMRDGELIETAPTSEMPIPRMISLMAGQEVKLGNLSRNFQGKEVILKVEGLTAKDCFRDVSFEVYKNEILGVSGLVGAGRTEVMLAIFGALPVESGSIYLKGKPAQIKSPSDAIRMGIGYLPEERRSDGIFPNLNVRENLVLPILRKLANRGIIHERQQMGIIDRYIKKLEIKAPSGEKLIRELSGGNQQKVIFARWIEMDTDILILDEPTRGIDVRAKDEIHRLIVSLAEAGKTIIVVSSEIEELLNISDRIMVMNEGRVKATLDAKGLSKNDILNATLN